MDDGAVVFRRYRNRRLRITGGDSLILKEKD
jgi:hypothetical protein